ncbi:hypothetical protein BJ138DRAFT_1149408 [Hygrophoropsis aurantiaca]|uniref:Uncharacterized protein n=1 Tax=Hygrophoropsis aurantiaca TaxID=72124 RepID=A0ACB8AFQ5_9AGAM|nr:hypothetical protein BJ138DRAFT_1149408 [Hygrophoropsis aurantiaca]
MTGPIYPIEVIQFWRGEDANGRPHPLDWIIRIRTSPERGNIFQVIGDIDTFELIYVRDHPYNQDLWRGTRVVGAVPAELLPRLEDIFAHVAVIRHDEDWNPHVWVWECIRRLRKHRFQIDVHLNEFSLQTAMVCLLESWEMGEI